MKGFLLDTNVISELRKGSRGNPAVLRWFDHRDEALLFVSVLTIGELYKGVELANEVRTRAIRNFTEEIEDRFRSRLLPVDSAVARTWGEIAGNATRRGRQLQPVDALLAATASVRGLVVATRNVRDFEASGVRTVNPFEFDG